MDRVQLHCRRSRQNWIRLRDGGTGGHPKDDVYVRSFGERILDLPQVREKHEDMDILRRDTSF